MKNRKFYRLLVLMLVILLGAQLCACESLSEEPTIVGEWHGYFRFDDYDFFHSWESGDKLYIYEDGTFRIDGESGDDSGKYELLYDGECITFNFGDCAYGPYTFGLEDKNTLVIDTEENLFFLNRAS